MQLGNKAFLADARGDLSKAIEYYEQSIIEESVGLLVYSNLICIYFQCMDFGFASGLELRPEVEARASTRALELIEEAESKFGKNDELEYWRRIIPFIGWSEPIGEWDLIGNSMVPYLYIAREDPSEKNLAKVAELKREIERSDESERTRYILSKISVILG